MTKDIVVTIGRQFGSGGHEIGQKLSKKLGVDFYDEDLIKAAAKQSGLSEEILGTYDEKPTNSLLYSMVMDVYPSMTYGGQTLDQQMNQVNYDTITQLAEKPCVIVGRAADYILRDKPNLVSIFVHASEDFRAERVKAEYKISDSEARSMMAKTDKRRASFYNFQAEKKWNELTTYNLCLDSSSIGIDKSVDTIMEYIKNRGLI